MSLRGHFVVRFRRELQHTTIVFVAVSTVVVGKMQRCSAAVISRSLGRRWIMQSLRCVRQSSGKRVLRMNRATVLLNGVAALEEGLCDTRAKEGETNQVFEVVFAFR